jgi:hypothetical protein
VRTKVELVEEIPSWKEKLMPFKSKRQARAMFGGHILGMSKDDAKKWADETKSIKKLPERAPKEKGKPTLRSKKGKTAALFTLYEDELAGIFKEAALGSAVMSPNNVGKLRGMMTTHAMKAPGYAASTQAMNPRKNVISAMNFNKPH